MREYLFELRKKINKTQSDIEKILKKYGVNLRYSSIECGRMWKDFSGERAAILAEALETTPEYLLECENKFGGYVGERYNVPAGKGNNIRSERNSDYDEPLTAEENAFAQKYISFAEKKISYFRSKTFKSALGNLMCYEDFYDLGMLAFLRSIKIIFAKIKRDPDLIKEYECPDTFYKHHFSHAIKAAYHNYIKRELTIKRKDYHHAIELDAAIDDDETEIYNFIPSTSLPVPLQVESSCALEALYTYLSYEQIYACKLMIDGWTQKEIINSGYASKIDIGKIKFYLMQIRNFGKVLWTAERYKSGTLNVNYNFTVNRWYVKLKYKSKFYCLGEYFDLNVALDLKKLAYFHIDAGDFEKWHTDHIQKNEYNIPSFTYPLPYDLNVDIDSLPIPSENSRNKDIPHATKENPIGIKFKSKANTFTPTINNYCLGTYDSLEKALEIRQIAEKYAKSGDFDIWYEKFKETREKEKKVYTRLDKHPQNGKIRYAVVRTYKRKTFKLGQYSYDDALQVKTLADSHIDAGDFDKWAKEYYERYKAEGKARRSAVRKNIKL